jgi:3-hydroxy-9,10-secoandrosta-1,3,5(10)-triene-9,17-dione monooxygenase
MNAPTTPRLDFAGVSYDEALDRARALIPVLRERAGRAEAARCLLPETVADLNRTGLMRILQPRRWGGMELDFSSIVDVTDIIGQGCMSTAWTLANIAVHHWMLALYEEEAQAELWGADPDVYIASGIAYPQGRGEVVEGGILLSGHWNFSSGVGSSTWNMLACVVRDADAKPVDYRMCVVPESAYEIIDDWQVMGLSGTGSMSVKCDKVFVPEHRALSMLKGRGAGDYPGWKTNPGPVFRIPFGGLAAHCILGAAIGNAQAMFDAVTAMVRERSTSYTTLKMRDLGTVQSRVGLAGASLEAARLMARNDCIDGQNMANRGEVADFAFRLKQKRNCAYAMKLATDCVDTLYALAGANGLYTRGAMERIYRDQHAACGHINFSIDAQTSAWGLAVLGGEVNNPTL